MNAFIQHIFIKFLLISVLVFFSIRGVKLLLSLISQKEAKSYINRYFPAVEISIWLIYFTWSIFHFFANYNFYSAILLVIIILLLLMIFWYGMRDFIAGIIFRFEAGIKPNEFVQINNYKGKIIKYLKRTFVMETDTGEQILVPYTEAVSNNIVKSQPEKTVQNYTFTIDISTNKTMQAVIEELRLTIISLPWSSLKKEPQIKILDNKNNLYSTEITIYAFTQEYFYKIEDFVREKYSINKE